MVISLITSELNMNKELPMQGMWTPGNFKCWSQSTPSSYTWRKESSMGVMNYQATDKSNLTQHQRANHERKKYPCRLNTRQLQRMILLTSGIYMKERSNHVANVTTRQLHWGIPLNSSKIHMLESGVRELVDRQLQHGVIFCNKLTS